MPTNSVKMIDEESELDYDLDSFEDLDENEKKFYRSSYPNVELVAKRRVHCTSCNMHIGTAPINQTIVRMHPILRVTQCKKCYTFYNSGEFEKGEDGSELYCRWCGQGGEVYCCSSCPYVFCKRCILANLTRDCVTDIQNNENWNCFSCSPKIMLHLRAQHWALVNYMDKQKRDISKQSLTEDEVNEAMNKDVTTCCKKMRRLSTPKPGKRKSSTPVEQLNAAYKKAAILPKLVNNSNSFTISEQTKSTGGSGRGGGDDAMVVCTPDIFSMFSQEETSPVASGTKPQQSMISIPPTAQHLTQANHTASKPVAVPIAPPLRPIIQRKDVTVRRGPSSSVRPQAVSVPAAGATVPVYHTINGFRIDLNTAAQHETYRLPNGKLIQVKKQIPPASSSTPPTLPPQITVNSNSNSLLNNLHRSLVPPQNIPFQSRPQLQIRPAGNIRVAPTVQQLHTQSLPALINQSLQQQQQQQQAKVPPPLFIRSVHPNTSVGNARTQFESRVENSMEVCQHIIGKINTLTNSTSYKTVKNFRDLKDLTIHLSYLLTYAIGRFKTLQEKCNDDMRKMGFVDSAGGSNMAAAGSGSVASAGGNGGPKSNSADGAASDDDDIEIVETQTPLIEIESDNEGDDNEAQTQTAAKENSSTSETPEDVSTTKEAATSSNGKDACEEESDVITLNKDEQIVLVELMEVDNEHENEISADSNQVITVENIDVDEADPTDDKQEETTTTNEKDTSVEMLSDSENNEKVSDESKSEKESSSAESLHEKDSPKDNTLSVDDEKDTSVEILNETEKDTKSSDDSEKCNDTTIEETVKNTSEIVDDSAVDKSNQSKSEEKDTQLDKTNEKDSSMECNDDEKVDETDQKIDEEKVLETEKKIDGEKSTLDTRDTTEKEKEGSDETINADENNVPTTAKDAVEEIPESPKDTTAADKLTTDSSSPDDPSENEPSKSINTTSSEKPTVSVLAEIDDDRTIDENIKKIVPNLNALVKKVFDLLSKMDPNNIVDEKLIKEAISNEVLVAQTQNEESNYKIDTEKIVAKILDYGDQNN